MASTRTHSSRLRSPGVGGGTAPSASVSRNVSDSVPSPPFVPVLSSDNLVGGQVCCGHKVKGARKCVGAAGGGFGGGGGKGAAAMGVGVELAEPQSSAPFGSLNLLLEQNLLPPYTNCWSFSVSSSLPSSGSPSLHGSIS